MDRKKRGNSKLYKSIVILVFLILLVLFFFLNTKIDSQLLIYDTLDKEIMDKKELSEIILKDNKNVNEQIELLNNIERYIDTVKTEYFKNIKKLEDRIISKESKIKIAYLTIDDGPYYLTYKFLEILDKYNVKATFFTIGSGKSNCYDNYSYNCNLLFKEIVKKGHTIANHTYSHALKGYLYSSVDEFMRQVKKQEELIFSHTNVITNILRFPGGSYTARLLKNRIIESLRQKGYGWVDWTAHSNDGKDGVSYANMWTTFKSTINEDIEVVLIHDNSADTYNLLPKMIEHLKNNGYILLPLFYESNVINK